VDRDIRSDHAIVWPVADDDRALMERLAALEAEVKADADTQAARKAAAVAKIREQRAAQAVERDELRGRQAALVGKTRAAAPAAPRSTRVADDAPDSLEDLGGALELASKANRVKRELARRPGKGEKSWIASGVASLALGPIGWLYAGSLREAVPAATGWVALAIVASKILPTFLMLPVLMVALPLSAIAGVVYALKHNRAGGRQVRLHTSAACAVV
jgi:hypothetical protein